jgi:myo-inositol-1(or 4)-monophosphatase
VSDADRAAEATIVAAIRKAHPEDAIVSEEGSGTSGTSGRRWLIDPLDGTINYLYRVPQWCVSIACLDDDGPFTAVVHAPIVPETFFAVRGQGAWLSQGAAEIAVGARGARRLAATTLDDPALALVATGYSYDADDRREQGRRESQLIGRIRDVRRFGAAALDLAFVAAGRIDAYLETYGNEWDWAAGRLLVQEAGGRVSEVPGVRAGVPGILASGSNVHDQLLAMIRAIGPA